VQTCGEAGEVTTRLYFDRPEVPESARVNVMEMGALLIDTLRYRDRFHDTTTVCDRELCRELAVELWALSYNFPSRKGFGRFEFRDSADLVADWGAIDFDDVRKESCP
jgi:hypothetical protein